MFVNIGTFDRKSGRKGKFGFPFSRGRYTPPEFIPDDTKKGEMAVALAFVSTILPYRNVTGFSLNKTMQIRELMFLFSRTEKRYQFK